MPFIPHTDAERKAMLKTIGVKHMDDLFADVPKGARFPILQAPAFARALGRRTRW